MQNKGQGKPFQKGHTINVGRKRSEEWKRKQSESKKGRRLTGEHKKKLSLSHIGKKRPFLSLSKDKEWRKHISESMKGKRKGEKSNFWKGGIWHNSYSTDWTETLRRSIRERDNYICQICSQYGNEVHHKDYDKENCNPENLITLCHSCHLKTNFNREYWIKYFGKIA